MDKGYDSGTSKISRKNVPLKRKWLVIWIIFIVCPLIAYTAEIFPRFIHLPVLPPDYYEGGRSGGWNLISKIIFLNWNDPFPPIRHFGYRTETYVSYDESHNIVSQESIIAYFDEELDNLGWQQSDETWVCQYFLAEAEFLECDLRNNYVTYRRNNYVEYTDFYEGDAVCLGVWQSSPNGFEVVMLTIRPAYYSILEDFIF